MNVLTQGLKDNAMILPTREGLTEFLTRCKDTEEENIKPYIGDRFGVYPVGGGQRRLIL